MISSNLRGHETSYNKPLPVPTVTNRCGGGIKDTLKISIVL